MEEESPPEQQLREQLTSQTQQQQQAAAPQPIFPWNQTYRGDINQNLFGSQLSGLGVNSRLTVNPTRPSVARIYNGMQSQLSAEGGAYNLKVSRLRFRFSAGLRIEGNDNINLTATNPESDLIVQPGIGIQGSWRLTKINSLDVNISLSKLMYLQHPEKNQTNMQISPGSQIALNVFAGDFRFTLHDRFSLQQDPVAVSGLNNTSQAGLFTNDIGMTVTWDLNQLILSLDLDHVNNSSLQAQPTYADQAMNSVTLSAMTALRRAVNVGVETGASYVTYSYPGQQNLTLPSNATLLFAGLFTEGRTSRFITLRAGLGYQVVDSASTATQPASRQGGWYGNLAMTHLVNPWITQTLDIGHEIAAGIYSNTEENTYLRHGMTFRIFHRASLSTQIAVEKVAYPNVTNSSDYTSYGGGILWNYRLTKKLSLDTQYQFVYRVSEAQSQNYTQNRIVLDLTYQF